MTIRNKFHAICSVLDERARRRWAASEAMAIGWGGVTTVSRATGISRPTIKTGIEEIEANEDTLNIKNSKNTKRIRKPGGGRKSLIYHDNSLIEDLKSLLESSVRGDPESPLLWTSKSTRKLAEALIQQGHKISHHTVANLLAEMDFSLQANRKTKEGRASHPDRDAQFEYINKQVQSFQKRKQPVVSVDAKKKELIGEYKNAGREWRPKGNPEMVLTKDFSDKELGKGLPYGVYDITFNNGWVSIGIDHDTAQFGHPSFLSLHF